MVTTAHLFQNFLDYLSFQKSYSSHTVDAYLKDLEQFEVYQIKEFDVTSFQQTNTAIIRSWIVSLMEANMKATTVNRKLSTLKSFFKYLRMMGSVDINPAAKVRNLKLPSKVPTYVRKSEANKLFDDITSLSDAGTLESTVIALLYNTGIRRAELIGLKSEDVDLVRGQIKVFGKGKKERIVPIGKEMVSLLSKYINTIENQDNPSNRFFVLPNGKPLYPKWVYINFNFL